MGKGCVRQWLQQFSAIGRAIKWNEGVKETTCKALARTEQKPNALMKLQMAPARPDATELEVNAKNANTMIKEEDIKLNVDTPPKDLPGSQMRQERIDKDEGQRGVFLKQLNKK